MKPRLPVIILALMIIVMVVVAGCGRSKEESATSKTPTASTPNTTQSAKLGTAQPAGPFEVALSTDPASPKPGKVTFIAKVTKDTKLAKNAKVSVVVSMPGMGESTVALKPSGDNYEGTGDLSMAGEWNAKVDVSEGEETGTAAYSLTVTQ